MKEDEDDWESVEEDIPQILPNEFVTEGKEPSGAFDDLKPEGNEDNVEESKE